MQVAGVLVARLRAPVLDRFGELFAVRTEIAGQGVEEGEPFGVVELVIAVENLARHRGAGGLAPARQQRLAQGDQLGPVRFGVGRADAAKQRPAALGNRGEKVGEKGVAAHGGHVESRSAGNLTWDLGKCRPQSSGHDGQR